MKYLRFFFFFWYLRFEAVRKLKHRMDDGMEPWMRTGQEKHMRKSSYFLRKEAQFGPEFFQQPAQREIWSGTWVTVSIKWEQNNCSGRKLCSVSEVAHFGGIFSPQVGQEPGLSDYLEESKKVIFPLKKHSLCAFVSVEVEIQRGWDLIALSNDSFKNDFS